MNILISDEKNFPSFKKNVPKKTNIRSKSNEKTSFEPNNNNIKSYANVINNENNSNTN